MSLNSGGYRTFLTRAVMNEALSPLGIQVIDQTPKSGVDDQMTGNQTPMWSVSDGRSYLATFEDNMVSRPRPRLVLPDRAVAIQAPLGRRAVALQRPRRVVAVVPSGQRRRVTLSNY